MAVYTGTDKGNYETETVTVTITRALCEHEAGDILYTGEGEKEPTCTESGLGHRECIKCGSVIESGIVAEALGHTGGTAVCSRCGYRYPESTSNPPEETHQPSSSADVPKQPAYAPAEPAQVPVTGGTDNQWKKPETGTKPGTRTKQGNGDTEGIRPDTAKIPFIKGEDGKIGWDVIRAEEENAEDGSVIHVDMNGTTVVPGDIFDSIKGRDITITFDMDNGIIWSVDGKSITTDKAGDIDFSVKTGVSAIPVDIVNNVTGESYSIQISLAYEGEFGFTAVLSINLGEENAGYTASLYYYNESTGELEFICSDAVAEDGTVSLAFTHASDYVIAIEGDEEEENDGVIVDAQPEETDGNDAVVPESPKTMQGKENTLWPIAAGIIALAGIAFAAVFVWKKKGENGSAKEDK